MVEQKIILEVEREIYAYGIENGFIIGVNFLTALLLGWATGRLYIILVFLFSYVFIRSYTGGAHLDNKVGCYFASSMLLLIPAYGIPLFLNQVSQIGQIIILLIAVAVILCNAPMDSKKRKLDEEERKHFRKISFFILGIEICIILIFYSLNVNDYAGAVYFAIVLTAILMIVGKILVIKHRRSRV